MAPTACRCKRREVILQWLFLGEWRPEDRLSEEIGLSLTSLDGSRRELLAPSPGRAIADYDVHPQETTIVYELTTLLFSIGPKIKELMLANLVEH